MKQAGKCALRKGYLAGGMGTLKREQRGTVRKARGRYTEAITLQQLRDMRSQVNDF